MIMIPAAAFVLCILGMVLQATFIAVEHDKKMVPAVILKGSASVVFVIIGSIAFGKCINTSFGRMVLIGLICGALGDILLNLRYLSEKNAQKIFLAGIAVFFAGHIMYLAALIPLSRNLLLSFVIGVICAACLLAYIFTKLKIKVAFKIFGIFYIGAIVVMTAVAIGNLLAAPESACIMFAIGAVLFTISDVVLIFNTFGDKTTFSRRIVNLSCYYVAQLLIACSVFLI